MTDRLLSISCVACRLLLTRSTVAFGRRVRVSPGRASPCRPGLGPQMETAATKQTSIMVLISRSRPLARRRFRSGNHQPLRRFAIERWCSKQHGIRSLRHEAVVANRVASKKVRRPTAVAGNTRRPSSTRRTIPTSQSGTCAQILSVLLPLPRRIPRSLYPGLLLCWPFCAGNSCLPNPAGGVLGWETNVESVVTTGQQQGGRGALWDAPSREVAAIPC